MKTLSKMALCGSLILSSVLAPSAEAVVGLITLPTAPVVGGIEIGAGVALIAAGSSATVVRCRRVPPRGPRRGPRRPGRTVCSRRYVGSGLVALGVLLLDENDQYLGARFHAPSNEEALLAGLNSAEAAAVSAEELKIRMIDDEVNAGASESWDAIAQATLSAEAYGGMVKLQLAATRE